MCCPCRPEKLEVSRGMQLEQVKRKIPSVLFSWDTYRISREGQCRPHVYISLNKMVAICPGHMGGKALLLYLKLF